MNRKVGEDVQKIILNFIGFFGPFDEGCHAYTNKGKKCRTKTAGNFIFCRKHKNLIQKLANGDDFKDTAIAYLLLCYNCLLYTSPSPRDKHRSRMPSSA